MPTRNSNRGSKRGGCRCGRPCGSKISCPRGWYDAGDYNKYIVNSGISTASLLWLLEDFQEESGRVETGIPEGDNALPDLLDEALWNLRWMLTMQDTDGGVHHKLTEAQFSGMVMPHAAAAPRWVLAKSTAAALNFAAVAALPLLHLHLPTHEVDAELVQRNDQ